MTLGELHKFIIHYVGNKTNEEGVSFSNSLNYIGTVKEDIEQLVLKNFNFDELYNFHFISDLSLNPVYKFIKDIFDNENNFIELSQNIARYLYEKSTHPKIKGGELCVLHFKNCLLKDEKTDCIGLFKSENKQTILEISKINNGFDINSKKGININKLDKGCLIFNTEKENGFLVATVDNTNKLEAQYWKNDFLNIETIKNEFHQTKEILDITKQFLTKQIQEEFQVEKTEQIDFLNKSVNYFKENSNFNKNDFEEKVFGDENLIASFQKFNQEYQENNDLSLQDNFDISEKAVKKQSRFFKSILKLDKNFHIYIHGNKDLIEKGKDENGKKFYKIYYDKER